MGRNVVIKTTSLTFADDGAHFDDLRTCAEYYCDLHFFEGPVFEERILRGLYKFFDGVFVMFLNSVREWKGLRHGC